MNDKFCYRQPAIIMQSSVPEHAVGFSSGTTLRIQRVKCGMGGCRAWNHVLKDCRVLLALSKAEEKRSMN